MRRALIATSMLLCPLTPALAQLSINFGTPGVSIGINLPVYPQLQRIPGYPVYYAPGVNSNYFFYDGMYWVYQRDNWYASSWYNGPWGLVDPVYVPAYVLRVPVRYYRHAPTYFHGWRADAAPHWGDHWGQSWEQNRSGWNQWSRNSSPAPAPLPTYQQQYSGNRYPQQPSQQAVIQTQSYRYQPKDTVAQQHYEQQRTQARSAPQQQVQQPQQTPRQQAAPQQQRPQYRQTQQQPTQYQQTQQQQVAQPREAPVTHEQQSRWPQPQQAERLPQQAQAAHEQHAPQAHEQERGAQGKGHDKGNEKEKGQEKDKDRGQGQER